MINDIIDGLTAALGEAFSGCEIYVENIRQGLTEPCFFVTVLEPSQQRIHNERHLLRVPLNVQYFPKEGYREINETAMTLNNILRRIELLNGDKLNGLDLHYEIVDNVLHYFVTYQMIIRYSEEEAALMEELTDNITTETGD